VTSLAVRMHAWFVALKDGDEGATAVEYALMLALIFMAVFAAVGFLGHATNNVYSSMGHSFPP
jgi:Flp pilus assembly pilin Flp